MHINKCKICKNSFEHKRIRFFCSRTCRYLHQGIPKTVKSCLECKQDFAFYKSIKPTKDAKFCNLPCRRKWNNNPENKIDQLRDLLDKYTIKNENACWGWKGPLYPNGYAQAVFMQRALNASRASWFIHHGLIKNNEWVLHKCDNPPCTNPDHLFLGTCKDNVQDMIRKGRKVVRKGSKVHFARINEEKAKEIKQLLKDKFTLKYISEKFGIHISAVSAIKNNRTWKHVV